MINSRELLEYELAHLFHIGKWGFTIILLHFKIINCVIYRRKNLHAEKFRKEKKLPIFQLCYYDDDCICICMCLCVVCGYVSPSMYKNSIFILYIFLKQN